MTTEQHLRLTHIAKTTDNTGYYIRFSAVGVSTRAQVAWDIMRGMLKNEGQARAKWTPDIKFKDGKKGAWWLSKDTMWHYGDSFANFARAMRDAETFNTVNDSASQRTTQQTLVIVPPHIQRALETLGMPADVLPTKDALKTQYRQLAMVHHPDHLGNAETFKTVTIARQIVLAYIELRERVGNAWNVA